MVDDDFFRTVWLPLSASGPLARKRSLGLTFTPGWTVLSDDAGSPLPPQRWAAVVEAAMETAVEVAEGWIEDGDERTQLVLRQLAASAAADDGDVLLRAFQVTEFAAIGLTVSVAEADTTPRWIDADRGRGPTMDEAASAEQAEPAVLGSPVLPRYLRLARDARTQGVSPELLVALAAEDRPASVKLAELHAAADASLERLRNPPLVSPDDEDDEPADAEVWLRYTAPLPDSRLLLTLTFCGYGDAGMSIPLAEASRVVASLALADGRSEQR
jgi:hypothetical protein